MGMFDSIYDPTGVEWQTKALGNILARYEVGSEIPGPVIDYQMEVIGDDKASYQWSFLTVRSGHVAQVPSKRDNALPLLGFSGGWTAERD